MMNLWKDVSWIGRLFSVLIPLQGAVIIGLTLERLVAFHEFNDDSRFAVALIWTTILFVAFGLDGVLFENRFELCSFLVVNWFAFLFILYQFVVSLNATPVVLGDAVGAELPSSPKWWLASSLPTSPPAPLNVSKWARFVFVCIFAPVNSVLGVLVFRSFGWKLYRKLGASVELTHIYQTYQVLVSLIKLDLQFASTVFLLNILFASTVFHVSLDDSMGFVVADSVVLLIGGLGVDILVWRAVRYEKRGIAIFGAIVLALEPMWLVFRAIDLAVFSENADGHPRVHASAPLLVLAASALMLLLTRIALIALTSHVCRKNFGRGLLNVFKAEAGTQQHRPLLE